MYTPPSSLTSFVPHSGHAVGKTNAGNGLSRSCFSTRTTCGMILPAFSTTTTSPTRTSFRSISSALCRLARLTIVPANSTGSRSATGVIVPVLPTWTRMSRSRVFASYFSNL